MPTLRLDVKIEDVEGGKGKGKGSIWKLYALDELLAITHISARASVSTPPHAPRSTNRTRYGLDCSPSQNRTLCTQELNKDLLLDLVGGLLSD